MGRAAVLQVEAVGSERAAASLDLLAAQIEAEAATLGGRIDGVLVALTDDVWRGPAAARTVERLRAGRARLHGAAEELHKVAALLRRQASEARSEAGDLRRRAGLAAAAEAAVRSG